MHTNDWIAAAAMRKMLAMQVGMVIQPNRLG
jgi:hypothetical protein